MDHKNGIIVSGIVMCTIGLILGIVMTFIALKVKGLVWQFDKIIPFMLIMMSCSLYSLVMYFCLTSILVPTVLLDPYCQQPSPISFFIPF